ncbi:hypothetical protein [Chryseobacterium pennipullorum]|uniref:DUF4595 domain-containing protein n=1 Tax=Chryseobacterium pennipullorum TaxID=2258963 RepID=A0A3D9B6K1_9FLAO|nr:hypothetical protein [Chryseobacterium pennipullorum]REC48958.1 hypothetical protein DRF67_05210 [Chryseobacterium pennipullorum]
MVKNYFLKMFAGIALLGLLASCNTTSDPTESIANPDEGTPPPKVLSKVTVNSVAQEEFVTTNAGVLEQAIFKDEKAGNAYYTGVLTYNTDKQISKIKFTSTASASLKYDFDITPAADGKIYNASCIGTAPTPGASHISDYTITYDQTTQKMTKILEKRKEGGISAYNRFVDYAFIYSGENISQVICSKGILDINGAPNMGTAVQTKYSFQNYDAQKGAYSKLPKTFLIIRSLIDPVNFYKASPNNPTSMYIQMPPPAASVNTAQSYSYDKEGYPAVEKNQNVTYTYKNVEKL